MTELSPAAQAVLDATKYKFYETPPTSAELAAWVLRAAADQVVPADAAYSKESPWQVGFADRDAQLRRDILAIAAELESSDAD